ncbi:MAG: glycoside hydrolase family 3 C-terminal domain-containing protein [Bacillota bacterium]|nr:glycoside hydrolase family 3 C-terminal domain-containing protein [Bacillota bacterium]
MNIKEEIISKLSLEEKIRLLSGKNHWQTVDIERLGIPSITVSDGPHGVRKEYTAEDGSKKTHEAVSFPTSSTMASTWNPELVREVGKALARECSRLDVDILLGPGTNIKRTPLCGRNFEYFSEDPLLAGEMTAAYIDGMQSQGVGTSLKHFAGNNQEYDRNNVSSEIDERTLREIYLKPFEIAVKKSQPWTVMCAYNRLNGIYCSENKFLLSDILRDEFGFHGIVMSDWWAVHDRAKSLKASLELEMPFTEGSAEVLRAAYERGEVTDEEMDAALERLLTIVYKIHDSRRIRTGEYDPEKQHMLAKEAALEGIVLLKNEEGILPVSKEKVKRLAVIGQYAKMPLIQGGGSARVVPSRLDSAFDRIVEIAGEDIEVDYVEPYVLWNAIPGVDVNKAIEAAVNSDMALLFVGNNYEIEGEGHDRFSMKLLPDMENLISRVASANENTVVVIQAGSAIDMTSWINKVKAVVLQGHSGQAAGSAVAEILFGAANPSGKLAETFPLSIEDTPAYGTYPGNGFAAWYSEGLMVGYRYYDTYNKEVLFPFGHGLSYTAFEYSGLDISTQVLEGKKKVTVKFKVKNTGSVQGKEVVQLYVKEMILRVIRPEKELKAFGKVELMPGEEKEIRFDLDEHAFEYYSLPRRDWHVEGGKYKLLIGASSRDIRLQGIVEI